MNPKLFAIGFVAFSLVAANAITGNYVVPGTADPWLAKALIDNVGTPEPADTAPAQSPVLAGSVVPGTTITWNAFGTVGHPGDPSGPDGNLGVITSRLVGANNGINDLPNTPINALIGVWGLTSGGGIAFLMGSAGSAVVPAGADELYLGTMDGFGWANNVGEYQVALHCLPDTGSTLSLMGLGVVAIAAMRMRRLDSTR